MDDLIELGFGSSAEEGVKLDQTLQVGVGCFGSTESSISDAASSD